MTKNRKNRRLPAMSLLPAEADVVVEAAAAAFRSGRKTQFDIYKTFCDGLDRLGVKPVSFSAFNRWTLTLDRGPSNDGSASGSPHPLGRGPSNDGGASGSPLPLTLGDDTRRLLAAGLRAMADDLVRDLPSAGLLSPETVKELREAFLQPVKLGDLARSGLTGYRAQSSKQA